METRKAWYGVYIGLSTFAEYATKNRSSALIVIWALEIPAPARFGTSGYGDQ